MTADELLEQHTPEVAGLVIQLRDVIRGAIPDATEKVYQGWHGIGFHHLEAGYVCALFPGDDYVKVGFGRGYLLPDPHEVFDSGGEHVRYATVYEMTPELANRLVEMVDHAVHLVGPK